MKKILIIRDDFDTNISLKLFCLGMDMIFAVTDFPKQ